jgi:hypothetical protein
MRFGSEPSGWLASPDALYEKVESAVTADL